ncbi:uncharacterized protein J3D65DRAFT_280754 [Phyllosticta citribraziliensis]|uniref:Uncharacterized protein n=1 Tax=Phyllosticta citribraziliensis TaxID=989973 RepID=A0ABR1LWD2_9PEZI
MHPRQTAAANMVHQSNTSSNARKRKRNGKRSLVVILRYGRGRALPTQNHLSSSSWDTQQQPEPHTPRRISDGSSPRNITWVSSPPPMSPITPLPPRQQQSNIMGLGDSSTINGNHSSEPRSSSLPAGPAPSRNRTTAAASPTPSQISTEPDDNTAPSSPALSPLAQHVGTLAEALICQLACAAIDQDNARLEALPDVERQLELIELCRRTTRTALEKVALDWARKLKEQGGAEGEFIEVERAAKEFESFKFARLAYVEDRVRRGTFDGALGSS